MRDGREPPRGRTDIGTLVHVARQRLGQRDPVLLRERLGVVHQQEHVPGPGRHRAGPGPARRPARPRCRPPARRRSPPPATRRPTRRHRPPPVARPTPAERSAPAGTTTTGRPACSASSSATDPSMMSRSSPRPVLPTATGPGAPPRAVPARGRSDHRHLGRELPDGPPEPDRRPAPAAPPPTRPGRPRAAPRRRPSGHARRAAPGRAPA